MLTCSVLGMALCLVTLRVLWRWPRAGAGAAGAKGQCQGPSVVSGARHEASVWGKPTWCHPERVSALQHTAMAQPPVSG